MNDGKRLSEKLRRQALNSWIDKKFNLVSQALREDNLDLVDSDEMYGIDLEIMYHMPDKD